MKNRSVRLKITLWFSILLAVIVLLTFLVVFYVSRSVVQKNLRASLVETVEDNVDEVEYLEDLSSRDNDKDLYLQFRNGYLEIDDDYLDRVNGIATALFQEDGTLLYGEDPIASNGPEFSDSVVQTYTSHGTSYYVYDRMLTGNSLDGLWLRGVVAQTQGDGQLSTVVRLSLILLPLLLLLAIGGGWLIAGRTLRPIQQISQAAAQISQGHDLNRRIHLDPGGDELHQLADAFDAMLDRLEASFAAEQQFTSDASHELRTPMSVIMAQCEYTLEEPRTPEEYRDALEVIARQGKKMSTLIRDMLNFTRLENQSAREPFLPLDLSSLVSSVCDDMALLQENGITLTSQVQPDLTVTGSTELLTRLLVNLISNAYRYGKPGGWISVTLQQTQTGITLSVADNGIGIAPDQQEKIFRRFYQADASRTGSGTGLGLSMVQEIVRLHGGTITVESQLDQGSTFTVTFFEKNETL